MAKSTPDHHDAELILRLYDLRRETVMRASRDALMRWTPKSWEDIVAILELSHPQNAAWRQVTSYFEMAYGFARHGVVNPDMLIESTGEGLFVFAKVKPYLERFRKEYSPTAFQNSEWILDASPVARQRFELVQARLAKMAAAAKP